MGKPVRRELSDAARFVYDSPGFAGVSSHVITIDDSANCALYDVTIEAPIDYCSTFDEEILVYVLEGVGTMAVGDRTFHLAPETAILIPGGTPHRHVGAECCRLLVFWTPPPAEVPHH